MTAEEKIKAFEDRKQDFGWGQNTAKDQMVVVLMAIDGLAGNISDGVYRDQGKSALEKIRHYAYQAQILTEFL